MIAADDHPRSPAPRLAVLLLAAWASACAGDAPPPPPAAAPVRPPDPAALHLGGTGAMMPLCMRLAEAWSRRGGVPRVVLEESIGSGGGIRAAADGALDLGMASRPLSEGEQRLGLREVPLGRDVVVVAAHPGVAADGIGGADLIALYRGERRSYPGGEPAVAMLRDRGESANLALEALVPGLAAAREDAYRARRLRVLYHDSAMAQALAATPGALGVFPLGAIRAFRLPLKVLALDGVTPSADAARDGRWRATRRLLFVARPDRLPRAEAFLAFVRSAEGRQIFDASGYLPEGAPEGP